MLNHCWFLVHVTRRRLAAASLRRQALLAANLLVLAGCSSYRLVRRGEVAPESNVRVRFAPARELRAVGTTGDTIILAAVGEIEGKSVVAASDPLLLEVRNATQTNGRQVNAMNTSGKFLSAFPSGLRLSISPQAGLTVEKKHFSAGKSVGLGLVSVLVLSAVLIAALASAVASGGLY